MGVSLARLNKTFKSADGDFAGGAAIISDPRLIQLVHELCSIRAHSVGAIAGIWREFQKDDRKATGEHMAASEEAKVNKGITVAGSRANKLNNAMEVDLVTTKARLLAELKAHGKFKSTKIEFLKKQVTGQGQSQAQVSKNPHSVQDQKREADQSDPPQGRGGAVPAGASAAND